MDKLTRLHRRTGRPRGNTATLRPGKPRTGAVVFRPWLECAILNERAIEGVSLTVASLLQETTASKRQVAKAMGQSDTHGIDRLLGGDDFSIWSLAAFATACGKRLVVSFEP